jgi:hypothetical protein
VSLRMAPPRPLDRRAHHEEDDAGEARVCAQQQPPVLEFSESLFDPPRARGLDGFDGLLLAQRGCGPIRALRRARSRGSGS